MINLKSIKNQLVIFLVCFAVYLTARERNTGFLLTTSLAIVFTTVAESMVLYFKEKKLTITASSIISGLIIGFVISSDQPIWIFSLASLFAVVSKQIFRIKGRHLFNPAGFGIFLTIILFGAQTQWNGTYIWYILVPAGLYFIFKIEKLELILGYFLASLILFGTQALMRHVSLLNIFGYLSYFYIFIMVIEPKTTPVKPLGKFIFGCGTASLIFILTEVGVKLDAELFSLLVMNLMVPSLNKLSNLNLVEKET
jgi:Na+-translocating ferredoxin:NAD+ oxidoreductase RnfD subunit